MARATSAIYVVHFRRRREGRTDYEKRLAHLKSGKTRMIVRKTNKYVIVQFANFDGVKGDIIITSCTSKALDKLGYAGKCNTPSAYLTGMMCAKKAMAKGVKGAILDMGLHTATKGSLVFAALKGAVDAGIEMPFNAEIMPKDERIKGAHLGEDAVKKFEECKGKIK